METAKLFINGRSQAVRLPQGCRFSGDEVGIKKVGDVVLLFPKDNAWENFLNSPPVSDDFFADGRDQGIEQQREAL